MAKKASKAAAILTVFNAAKMTAAGRKEIVLWLRRQARMLTNGRYVNELAPRYTARYLYAPQESKK